MNDELLNTIYVPITVRINGLSERQLPKFFNSIFDKETLEYILARQIETENYEICPFIHKALNDKL